MCCLKVPHKSYGDEASVFGQCIHHEATCHVLVVTVGKGPIILLYMHVIECG